MSDKKHRRRRRPCGKATVRRDKRLLSDMAAVAACLTDRVEAAAELIRDPDPMRFHGRLAMELAYQGLPVRRACWEAGSHVAFIECASGGGRILVATPAVGLPHNADLDEDDLEATDWELRYRDLTT